MAAYYGPQAAEGFLHTFSGWLVFVAAFVLLLAMQQTLARAFRVKQPDVVGAIAASRAA